MSLEEKVNCLLRRQRVSLRCKNKSKDNKKGKKKKIDTKEGIVSSSYKEEETKRGE